jgi:hypothetical protein
MLNEASYLATVVHYCRCTGTTDMLYARNVF